MQDFGLQTAYRHDRGTYSFVRKIMALPFLPEREIRPMFEALHNEVSGTLIDFAEYVSSTWINGSTWAPTDWTCYKQAIQTNNDVEGWHNGLNRWASGRAQLPMYLLIQLLYREAKLTVIQIHLVSESSCDESSDESIGSYSREYLSSGTSTRPGKGQPDNYWRPALILMDQ